MAEPGTLTDAELIDELAQYGEVVQLPIKPNKRPILLKKLNHLRARNKVPDVQPTKGRTKANSKLILPPPTSPSQPSTHFEGDRFSGAKLGSTSGITSRSRSRRFPPRELEAFSSDDSDAEPLPSTSYSQPKRLSSLNSSPRTISPDNRSHFAKDKKREPQFATDVLRIVRRRTGRATPRQTRRSDVIEVAADDEDEASNSFNLSGNGSDDDIPVPSPARSSRLYPDLSGLTSYLSKSKASENAFESSDSDVDAPNGSTYEVENKSVNTSFPVHGAHSQENSSFNTRMDASDFSFGSHVNISETPMQAVRSRRLNTHPRVQQYKSWYLETLPQLLVVVTALFFAGIAATYIATHKDLFFSWFSTPSNMGSGDHILMCKDGVPRNGCYLKEEIDRALSNIETMFHYLSDRKGKVMCDAAKPGDDVVSASVLQTQIYSQSVAKTNSERLFQCCIDHILANPHWNLRALRADGSLATTVPEVAFLESSMPSMSLWCRVSRSFAQVLYGLCFLCLVIACVFLGYMYLKYKLKQREEEQRDVFTMVEKIIDVLQEHDEQNKNDDSDEPSFMAIQHVRDQLLPAAKRRKHNSIWEKAVAFIAANESRIRTETRLIRGEEFEVWLWLQPSVHNGKIWQGQAFGENDNNSNQVIYSPTPCLKIRNMFDSNVESEEGWEECVTDAILEKCRHIGNILHVFVDTFSREGCVYLKCSDCPTAGKVRLALHGWWFDGRLVTVKHLKTEHYHKRWPESRNATIPCKPSSNQMKSLSQPFYRSSLEMT